MFVSSSLQARFPVSKTPVSRSLDQASADLLFAGGPGRKKKLKTAKKAEETAAGQTPDTNKLAASGIALAAPLEKDAFEKQTPEPLQEEALQTQDTLEKKALERPGADTVASSEPDLLANKEKTKAQTLEKSAASSDAEDDIEKVDDFSDSGEEIEPLTEEEKAQAEKEHHERKMRRYGEKLTQVGRMVEGVENKAKATTRTVANNVNSLAQTLQDVSIDAASSSLQTLASGLNKGSQWLESNKYKRNP